MLFQQGWRGSRAEVFPQGTEQKRFRKKNFSRGEKFFSIWRRSGITTPQKLRVRNGFGSIRAEKVRVSPRILSSSTVAKVRSQAALWLCVTRKEFKIRAAAASTGPPADRSLRTCIHRSRERPVFNDSFLSSTASRKANKCLKPVITSGNVSCQNSARTVAFCVRASCVEANL